MASIDLTQENGDAPAPAPTITDLTQEDSDDEPPAKRAKAATPDLAQLRREREARRGAPAPAPAARSLQLRTRPDQLPALWRAVATEGLSLPVIPFYGHTHGAHKCFSNFFASPFDFALPACCSAAPRTLRVAFGEQAIMACKAAAMGDWASYDKISRSTTSPKACKALGRKVKPFRQDVWAGVVVEVAVEIATQKFARRDGRSRARGDDEERQLLGHGHRPVARGRADAVGVAGHEHPGLRADGRAGAVAGAAGRVRTCFLDEVDALIAQDV